jgi:antirestriction protein ArdC
MNLEQLKKLTNESLDELVASLEGGRSETLTNYLAAIGRFHRYSLHNVMLIALQMPRASYVAGFRTWKKLGRLVRKGEKGIAILAPLVRHKSRDNASLSPEESPEIFGFRAAWVFDVSQTEGAELPSIGQISGDPRQHLTRLVLLVRENNIVLEYSEKIAPALGRSEGGKRPLFDVALRHLFRFPQLP